MYQYLPGLLHRGWEVDVVPLFDDVYLEDLYSRSQRRLGRVLRAYARRLARLSRGVGTYDVVWLEKECWPWVPAVLDPGLLARRARWVVDYDDAIFHSYDLHPSALVRWALGRKIDAVMRAAAVVVAGNAYLAERASRSGARRVEVVPSGVDLERYPRRPAPPAPKFTVGWIGTPVTQHFLTPIVPSLVRSLEPVGGQFVTIGGRFREPLFPGHEAIDWHEATEVDALRRLDVGIMPLTDTPFERGKCGFKLIQYMACGLPTVASPVGMNRELANDGETGLLASDPAEWEQAIAALRDDPARRRRIGEAGRSLVERRYCLQVIEPLLAQLLTEVAHSTALGELIR